MFHAGAAYLVHALPSAVPAFIAGAELALLPELRVGLAALVSLPGTLDDFAGGRVEQQLFGGEATACLNAPISAVLFLGCAGVSAAIARAKGIGYTTPFVPTAGWLAGLATAAVELPATSTLAVRLIATGRVNVLRPQLRVELPGAAPAAETRSVPVLGGSFGGAIVLRIE